MLVIRLRRTGKKKKPSFRVVVAEKTMPIYGRFVDIIGNVNLQAEPKVINIDKEKALSWIKKGAKPSHTVARLMVKQGILKEEDVEMKPEKKRPKKKELKAKEHDTGPETGEKKEDVTPQIEQKEEKKAPAPAEGDKAQAAKTKKKPAEKQEKAETLEPKGDEKESEEKTDKKAEDSKSS